MSLPCQKDLQNARPVAESYAIGKPSAVECIERVASNLNETGVPIAMAQSSVDMECVQSISGSPTPPAVLQFPKQGSYPLNGQNLERRDTISPKRKKNVSGIIGCQLCSQDFMLVSLEIHSLGLPGFHLSYQMLVMVLRFTSRKICDGGSIPMPPNSSS
ncbi:hypothetical protein CK203_009224 [Vitis vinifera]|uniref:Uncharacterized protein n=1 Tax=Vitis vinifera TaxID=29760 RepID=A0A438K2K6_VITVI|nr:hypothetical protein CK203_009224 [Vitis vinifera]